MNNVSIEDEIIKIIEENFNKPEFNVNSLSEKIKINRSYLYKHTLKNKNCNSKFLIETKRIIFDLELPSKEDGLEHKQLKK